MDWKKASPEMTAFLDAAVAGYDCQRKKMFGYPVYFVHGNMFAGLHQDDLFLRLSSRDQEEIMAAWDEAALLEPMPGRPMKDYVVLPDSLYNDSVALGGWLERSFQHCQTLPAREPKEPRKKRR